MNTAQEAQEAKEKHGVRREFEVMYAGWELDYKAWLLNNGQLVFTSHGSPYFDEDGYELDARIKGAEIYLAELQEVKKEYKEINGKEEDK